MSVGDDAMYPVETHSVPRKLRSLVSSDLWQEHFERCCGEGAGGVAGEVGRYRSVLAAFGLAATENEVRVALRLLAVELHPYSIAARQIKEGTGRTSLTPPLEQASMPTPASLPTPAQEVMARAMSQVLSRATKLSGGVPPMLEPLLATVGPRSSWGDREYVLAVMAGSSQVVQDLLKLYEASDSELLLDLTQEIYAKALELGCTTPPENFTDHVHRVRHEVYGSSPDSRDGEWLSALDEQVMELLDRYGLSDALPTNEHAAYVERALALTLSGDRAGARNEYRRLYRAAKLARANT